MKFIKFKREKNNASIQIQNSFVQCTNDIVLFYMPQDLH